MRIILLVGIASLAVACAARDHGAGDRPPAPTTSANTAAAMATSATSSPAATSATSSPAVASAVTPASVSSTRDQAETVDQSLVKRGYRPRQLKGQLLYCRSQTLTGTRFSSTVCLTEAQIKANDKNTQSELDTMSRAGRAVCPNPNGCN